MEVFMKKKLMYVCLTFILLIITGCGNNLNEKKNNQLTIYTTVYPLQYFTEIIGGNYVDVTSIYPPGTDEHTYEPSQKDMMNLADADLFFYIGYGLEGFAKKAEATLNNEHVKSFAIGEEIKITPNEHHAQDNEHESHDDHHHGDVDPHIWLDPIYAKELAQKVLESLINEEPQYEQIFKENYEELANKLDELNANFVEVAENAKQKKFIVAHAAYGYWESRYGLEQVAIAGISSTEEPSQKKLTEIVDTVKKENIPYILFEQNVNSHLAEIIQAETGINSLHIHNLAVLTDMEITNKETYFTLMEKNVDVLEKALNE